jgi:hypothetical protein
MNPANSGVRPLRVRAFSSTIVGDRENDAVLAKCWLYRREYAGDDVIEWLAPISRYP